MTSDKKRVSDGMMQIHHSSLCQVPQRIVIFILSYTVVSIQMHVCFPQSMFFKVVVHVTDGWIGSFAKQASSMTKLACLGMPSQITPNIPHFLGVL